MDTRSDNEIVLIPNRQGQIRASAFLLISLFLTSITFLYSGPRILGVLFFLMFIWMSLAGYWNLIRPNETQPVAIIKETGIKLQGHDFILWENIRDAWFVRLRGVERMNIQIENGKILHFFTNHITMSSSEVEAIIQQRLMDSSQLYRTHTESRATQIVKKFWA